MTAHWTTNLLIILASAALWVGAYQANGWFMSFANQTPGISLLFVPSGLRLLALMVGGLPAAIGISIGALICVPFEFQGVGFGPALMIALVGGVGPYLALRAACRFAGIAPELGNLTPLHLPLIALCVAAGSAVLHNILFAALSINGWRDFGENFMAMMVGDFLGSLITVLLVLGAMRLLRRVAQG